MPRSPAPDAVHVLLRSQEDDGFDDDDDVHDRMPHAQAVVTRKSMVFNLREWFLIGVALVIGVLLGMSLVSFFGGAGSGDSTTGTAVNAHNTVPNAQKTAATTANCLTLPATVPATAVATPTAAAGSSSGASRKDALISLLGGPSMTYANTESYLTALETLTTSSYLFDQRWNAPVLAPMREEVVADPYVLQSAIAVNAAVRRARDTPPEYEKPEYNQLLAFSPTKFHAATVPILWHDATRQDYHQHPTVHWNAAAEKGFFDSVYTQQFPSGDVDCTKLKYIIVPQSSSGFFSRYNIGIITMQKALSIKDRMVVFTPTSMFDSGGGAVTARSHDDFGKDGVKSYFAPFARCEDHSFVYEKMRNFADIPQARSYSQLHPGGDLFNTQFVKLSAMGVAGWVWDGEQPEARQRKLLFDFGVTRQKTVAAEAENKLHELYGDHQFEHVYTEMHRTSAPASEAEFAATLGDRRKLMDEWFLHMISEIMFRPAAHVMLERNLMHYFWSTQLTRLAGDYALAHQATALVPLASIILRRGDKCGDDSYCQRHKHFRGPGLFLQEIFLEEQKRGVEFKAIYVMSDDNSQVTQLVNYGDAGEQSNSRSTVDEVWAALESKDDDRIARAILKGRRVMYHPYSPPASFDPAKKEGFEGFLSSMSLMAEYSSLIVHHESSNLCIFLARHQHVKWQLDQKHRRTKPGSRAIDAGDDYYTRAEVEASKEKEKFPVQ